MYNGNDDDDDYNADDVDERILSVPFSFTPETNCLLLNYSPMGMLRRYGSQRCFPNGESVTETKAISHSLLLRANEGPFFYISYVFLSILLSFNLCLSLNLTIFFFVG